MCICISQEWCVRWYSPYHIYTPCSGNKGRLLDSENTWRLSRYCNWKEFNEGRMSDLCTHITTRWVVKTVLLKMETLISNSHSIDPKEGHRGRVFMQDLLENKITSDLPNYDSSLLHQPYRHTWKPTERWELKDVLWQHLIRSEKAYYNFIVTCFT